MRDAEVLEALVGVVLVLVAVGYIWTWFPMLGAGIVLVAGNVCGSR